MKTTPANDRQRLAVHDRKAQLLEFILAHFEERGFAPTIRGMAQGIGVSATRAAQLVDKLVAEGIVRHVPGMARTLTVDRAAAARSLDRP